MTKVPSKKLMILFALLAAVVAFSLSVSPPASAVQSLCFICTEITIPDPTGGSFSHTSCLADAGHAIDCVDLGSSGCVIFGPGSCV